MESIVNNIFSVSSENFIQQAQLVYQFQLQNNAVYAQWQNYVGRSAVYYDYNASTFLTSIPYLPISLFKSHAVKTTQFEPEVIFESSGTTQGNSSKHFVKDMELYRQSFLKGFEMQYGSVANWCILGLLPAYLERKGSSLVTMVNEMIQLSHHPKSGFYLYNHATLAKTLIYLEAIQQPTLLIGVTFALLDFAEAFPMQLNNTIVMETGGMKGRKKELTRNEVHEFLKQQFEVNAVHAEYGMTELLSQAYSTKDGIYRCPPWMKVLVRSEEDPLNVSLYGKGAINVIDMCNAYSCSFIATDDVGEVFEDGSFTIFGRLDNSDLRGCSLLVTQ